MPGSPIVTRPIRILVAVANPAELDRFGLPSIDPDGEFGLIQEALAGIPNVELLNSRARVRYLVLKAPLRDRRPSPASKKLGRRISRKAASAR